MLTELPGIPPPSPSVLPLRAEQLLAQENRYRFGQPQPPDFADAQRRLNHAQVDLVLYVSAISLPSSTAVKRLREKLHELGASAVHLRIVDVAKDVEAAAADRVLYTPTLVCRVGGRAMHILGDLTHEAVILEAVLQAAAHAM